LASVSQEMRQTLAQIESIDTLKNIRQLVATMSVA
jgi:hypothetical protein